MKFSMLAATLSLALGTGTAMAAQMNDPHAADYQNQQQQPQPQQQQDSQTTETTTETETTTTTTEQEPADVRASTIQSVDLLFDTNSAQLKEGARDQLLSLARWAKCNKDGAVILEGHADPRGTQALNLKLSANRAAAVRAQLIRMGVPSDRIVVTVFGKNGPRRATFAEDRRVTIRATGRPVQASAISAMK